VKEHGPSRCSTDVFSRVDLARALRVRIFSAFAKRLFLGGSALGSGFAPVTSRPFGSGPRARSSLDLAVDHVPARSYRRSLPTTSLVRRSRRARSPPPRVFLPRRRPARWLGLPGARGCGPVATPVLSTDVCSSRILFSKTIAPRLGARRIAMFPRDARACGFTPQRSLR
jgi:hypothetical protein